jgi:3-oxoacyl-[acyl-carrier protein] reductase
VERERMTTTMDLDGLVAIVTGGTRGIGRAIVLEAVRRGARVVFCARHVERGGPEVEAEAMAGVGKGRTIAIQADVSQAADVARLFDTARERFGRVDIAINNAGTSASELLVSHSASEWDRVVTTNVIGCLLVARELVRESLRDGRPGALVTIGSIAQCGAATNSSYATTKGALVGMTEAIARDYGPTGIRANLVVAGLVDTELAQGLNPRSRAYWLDYAPVRRAGTPAEIASVALFLASTRSRHLNGRAVLATGGLLQCPA